jgi:hypothetical protein
LIALAAVALAACAGQMEPAQRAISDIQAIVSAATPDAAQYAPDQLVVVEGKLGELQASFSRQDYAAVLAAAPAVMSAAQGLAGAAAAKKDEITKELNRQWSALAAVLPDDLTAIQNRIDSLGKVTGRKHGAAVDLEAVRAALSRQTSLWSKSQAAFATGNLGEAVTTARTLQTNLQALAATLNLQLPQVPLPHAPG